MMVDDLFEPGALACSGGRPPAFIANNIAPPLHPKNFYLLSYKNINFNTCAIKEASKIINFILLEEQIASFCGKVRRRKRKEAPRLVGFKNTSANENMSYVHMKKKLMKEGTKSDKKKEFYFTIAPRKKKNIRIIIKIITCHHLSMRSRKEKRNGKKVRHPYVAPSYLVFGPFACVSDVAVVVQFFLWCSIFAPHSLRWLGAWYRPENEEP